MQCKVHIQSNQAIALKVTLHHFLLIQDIMWVELYDKFCLLILVQCWNDWFYLVTPPLMETCKKVKVNQKRQKTLEHRAIVEELLGEVELIL